MSKQTIYAQLIKAGLSPVGACGLMGNMQAESAMRSNNAQDGMTRMSDAEYTAATDNGSYTNFVRDAVGYGLCQWTYHTRKQNLLNFAKSKGKSIGNEAMQVEFTIKELKSEYPGLWSYLCSATNLYEAASKICKQYERPAINNVEVRATAARQFYNELSKTTIGETHWPPRTIAKGMSGADVSVLQAVLVARGYDLVVIDNFDDVTDRVVKEFQKTNGLVVDGIAGEKTWTKLLER